MTATTNKSNSTVRKALVPSGRRRCCRHGPAHVRVHHLAAYKVPSPPSPVATMPSREQRHRHHAPGSAVPSSAVAPAGTRAGPVRLVHVQHRSRRLRASAAEAGAGAGTGTAGPSGEGHQAHLCVCFTLKLACSVRRARLQAGDVWSQWFVCFLSSCDWPRRHAWPCLPACSFCFGARRLVEREPRLDWVASGRCVLSIHPIPFARGSLAALLHDDVGVRGFDQCVTTPALSRRTLLILCVTIAGVVSSQSEAATW